MLLNNLNLKLKIQINNKRQLNIEKFMATRKQNIIPGDEEVSKLQKIPFRIVHVSSNTLNYLITNR